MKQFVLTQADLDKLILLIDQNPEASAGSHRAMSDAERRIFDEAHRFYNYHIRGWISEMTK